jgi:hypothetical protein
MPLFQYFGWVGSFLLAALFAANWCYSAPIAPAPLSDVPLDQKVLIRIHTDHKWPERVELDTTRSTLAHEASADGETDVGGRDTSMLTEREPFDAFAEMALSGRPCFRPPCSARTQAIENRTRFHNRVMAARKSLTCPNPLHKPPGRS